jgi:hypothetical protein
MPCRFHHWAGERHGHDLLHPQQLCRSHRVPGTGQGRLPGVGAATSTGPPWRIPSRRFGSPGPGRPGPRRPCLVGRRHRARQRGPGGHLTEGGARDQLVTSAQTSSSTYPSTETACTSELTFVRADTQVLPPARDAHANCSAEPLAPQREPSRRLGGETPRPLRENSAAGDLCRRPDR